MPRKGERSPQRNDAWTSAEDAAAKADPRGMEALGTAFLEWLLVRNYSPETVKTRTGYLRHFARWCHERGMTRPAEVTKQVIERYQHWLYHYRNAKTGQPMSTKSQWARLVPLRAWFRWLSRENHVLYNPTADIDLPRMEKCLPRVVLSKEEAEAVLAQPDTQEPLGLRDRAALEVLYSTGIRRLELARLKLHDLDDGRGVVMVRQGKGKKDRVVPVGERARQWVRKYAEEVRPGLLAQSEKLDPGHLFLTGDGEPFSPNRLSQMVRDHVKASGISKTGSCHLFRHTCATLMLEGGADVRYVQALLGHAELSTTQIYTQVSIRKLQEVHRLTHPAKAERGSGASGEAQVAPALPGPEDGRPGACKDD